MALKWLSAESSSTNRAHSQVECHFVTIQPSKSQSIILYIYIKLLVFRPLYLACHMQTRASAQNRGMHQSMQTAHTHANALSSTRILGRVRGR